MANKYRLLRDMPDADSGTIFQERTINPVRLDWIVFCPVGRYAPSVTRAGIEDTEWFEPVEDRWVPQVHEKYWSISACLSVGLEYNNGHDFDKECIAARNCFRSEALAELAAEKVRQCLTQFHEEYTR